MEDQGANVELHKKTIGEDVNLNEYDFVFMGCGTERNLDVVLSDFKLKKEELVEYINKEKVILFTGNSFEMLGDKIDDKEGLRNFRF